MIDKQQQALEAILNRAAIDLEFRRELLGDPRGAIERAFGLVIPPKFRVRFIERDLDLDALVVLPDFRPVVTEAELSDQELETASGGTGPGGQWASYESDDE